MDEEYIRWHLLANHASMRPRGRPSALKANLFLFFHLSPDFLPWWSPFGLRWFPFPFALPLVCG